MINVQNKFCSFKLIGILHLAFKKKVKDFKQNKEALDRELKRFMAILDELLPRYSFLLEKKDIAPEEITELGDIEHYLIEVNSKISGIKSMLEQDLFGHSLDIYYKLKAKATTGDVVAMVKFERMKVSFEESLKSGNILIWN